MRILISNDDGYQAKGIKQLAESLSEIADIIIVAPNENKSAASSSLSIGKPLILIQIEHNIYAIDATPSACVLLALCGFIKESIDLVVTGINFGPNLGDDVIYSGTVAGAIEGRFIGLPSIAISLASFECEHFETAGAIAKQLVAQIDKAPLSYNTIINVNVPLSLGFVNIPTFLIFIPITTFMAKIGAESVHKFDKRLIGKLLGIYLFIISCKLFYEYFSL